MESLLAVVVDRAQIHIFFFEFQYLNYS